MSEKIATAREDITYTETDDVIEDVVAIIQSAQAVAHKAIDTTLVRRNWLVGMRIVNEELKGGVRSETYGRKVVPRLAEELTRRFGRGYTRTSLYQYVKFYRMFPEIVQTASGQSPQLLSWSHYIELLRVEDPHARAWYEREAADQAWSVRTLSRNISTQWYHRLLANHADLSAIPNVGMSDAEAYAERLAYIKSPVIVEFLGLPDDPHLHETELESAILANLQSFLLELGKGYAFVARQEHIRTERRDYFIDLVFYNYILKCFVLIDLKTDTISHQDVGQMDMYVRMYDDLKRSGGDGPTLGIVLCAETDEDVARYSILHDSDQLFAAKYRLYLPSEEQLRAEIEEQKRIFQAQHEEHAMLPEGGD
jgi:predicted nuclease of restriction endonuclease-like (RecB) superfamily